MYHPTPTGNPWHWQTVRENVRVRRVVTCDDGDRFEVASMDGGGDWNVHLVNPYQLSYYYGIDAAEIIRQ